LPEVYAASTVLVVPSDHEPWGLTVNEAMLSGTPVIASDRVGARLDLIEGGRTGYVYPSGDLGALASVLRRLLAEPQRAADMGRWARRRMDTWSPRENADGVVRAVELAVQRRRGLR
jgi:glycosyltransferase involved in cell wall biosynthesis